MAEALGMIDCRSFAAMVEAADAMVKAAKVDLVLPLGRADEAAAESG